MKFINKGLCISLCFCCLVLCGCKAGAGVKKDYVRTLLDAIAKNDYESFMSSAAPSVREGISEDKFRGVSAQIAMKYNYNESDLSYMGAIDKDKFVMTLWKLAIDGESEMLVKVVVDENDKLVGFWLE